MLILEIDESTLIDGVVIGVKDRLKRRRRNILFAVAISRLDAQSLVGHTAEEPLSLFAVLVFGDAVVCRRIVEFFEKQPAVAVAAKATAGDQQLKAVVKLVAVAKPPVVGAKTPARAGHFESFHLPAAFGLDINNPHEGAAAIKRRARPANDFNAGDQ